MKVFISWSGELSHKVGQLFFEWLPNVVQSAKPFLSSEDIEKGMQGSQVITSALNESQVGIVCLDQSNVDSRWILFEAGCIAKETKSRLLTFLINIDHAALKAPLANFQYTTPDKEQVKKMVLSVSRADSVNSVPDSIIKNSFEQNWTHFESEFKKITQNAPKTVPADLSDKDKIARLEEKLNTLVGRVSNIEVNHIQVLKVGNLSGLTGFPSLLGGSLPPGSFPSFLESGSQSS